MSNAADAIAALMREPLRFALVLTDMMMPLPDGIDLLTTFVRSRSSDAKLVGDGLGAAAAAAVLPAPAAVFLEGSKLDGSRTT